MKVWHKMLLAPSVAIVFLLALGALAVGLMARQGMAIASLTRDRGASIELVITAYRELNKAHVAAYRTFTLAGHVPEPELRASVVDHARVVDAYIRKTTEFRNRSSLHPDERALVDTVIPQMEHYRTQFQAATADALALRETAKSSLGRADASFGKVLATFTTLGELQGKLSAEASAQGAANFRGMVISLGAVAVAAAVISLGLALLMARQVVRRLRAASDAAREVARGDLTATIEVRGRDEAAELLQAQSRMQQDLRRVVGEVLTGARAVAGASAQIAQGNQDLSQRTEMQASTLEETASSMEELTSTVQQNADNARQASALATEASGVARKGGDMVADVVNTMNGISDSSRRISEIIGVIDGIAFQTNILALNAAVEAARAGEQGRGFAVVAAEVRNLAQRSAAAAREIKGLIGESVDKVEAGNRLAHATGATMQDMVRSVTRVSDLVAEIAAASQEQSSGIVQVNTAVSRMEEVVQQNASLVEEASAATEAMKAQSEALLELVSRFRLPEEAAQARPAAPAAEVPAIRVREPRQPVVAAAPVPQLPAGPWREF
ncbi:HAMP domain-containing protein [Ramlibacter sp. USB13]|uniref:HAMP domain-containing protein n=1 Tax=Ramlibacter cellulosilyticus TaxID=2764187 RepID=A0A923MQ02_9BURK|nr:methyl-accepting chemotaxis protein [Ramlibacter cellulosilyticus]MBC5782444.1 HAMP domain-containing protein [Ramlibacter cellulosilyticus]